MKSEYSCGSKTEHKIISILLLSKNTIYLCGMTHKISQVVPINLNTYKIIICCGPRHTLRTSMVCKFVCLLYACVLYACLLYTCLLYACLLCLSPTISDLVKVVIGAWSTMEVRMVKVAGSREWDFLSVNDRETAKSREDR